jgi:hypothetical protein
MTWHAIAYLFVALALGAAFGAVPLSGVLRMRSAPRKPVPAAAPAMPDEIRGEGARIIPFPVAYASDGADAGDAMNEARRA